MKENEIKGLVFDCDGTLADTMPLHWRAWQTVVNRHRIHFTEERFYSLGGVPSRDILKMLSLEQGVTIDHLAVAHEKEDEYLPLLHQVEPVNAVVAIVRENHGRVPMAVASGGVRKIICQVLEHLDIHRYFDAIVTSEDVVNQKPAPDIFLAAAKRWEWTHNSAARTKILIWDYRPSAPPEWKPWMCGSGIRPVPRPTKH